MPDSRPDAERDPRGGTPPAEAPFAIEESLGYLVNFVAKGFTRALSAALAPHGVTHAQWAVLVFLWAEEGLSQKELSRRVAIEEATMVRTLDRMERDGFVHRQRDIQDRRRSHIFLTEEGRALRDTLVPCAVAVNATAAQPLSAAEQRQLMALLRRVIPSLTTLTISQTGNHA